MWSAALSWLSLLHRGAPAQLTWGWGMGGSSVLDAGAGEAPPGDHVWLGGSQRDRVGVADSVRS